MASIIAYHNLLETGTITVTSEAAGFPKENAYDNNTFDYWKIVDLPGWIRADMTSPVPCDYFAVAAHTLSTVSATISFQWSDDNASWFEAFAAITPSNNSPIFKSFSSLTKRYWRVVISNGAPLIGFLSFGVRLDLTTGMAFGFDLITESRKAKLINNVSENGEFLGRSVISQGGEGKIQLRNLSQSWVRANWPALANAIQTKPFIFQWDNTNYESETVLCWVKKMVPTPKYAEGNILNATIDVSVL